MILNLKLLGYFKIDLTYYTYSLQYREIHANIYIYISFSDCYIMKMRIGYITKSPLFCNRL